MSDPATSTDRLRAIGAYTLGDKPAPEARQTVLRNWLADLNGADPLTVATERLQLVELGFPASLVDAAVRSVKSDKPDERQGTELALKDPEKWPDPVDGADLLDELGHALARYLIMPRGAVTAIALWIVHTHAHDAADISPVLAVTSPEKRCGKSTLLILLSALVPRPMPVSHVTPAILFRVIERDRPTCLLDEADTFLGRADELRGALNSGHSRRMAWIPRTVGDDYEPRMFSTWAPKAIALIGKLKGTLADRSIEVRMHRKRRDEKVERVRAGRIDRELESVPRKAWTWAQAHLDALKDTDADVPAELHDRAADNWRPLLAIADLAGGDWPDKARQAAKLLSGLDPETENSAGIQMLADMRDLFEGRGVDKLFSADIVGALADMEDRPWPEWKNGKPITTRQLARLLKPFGVTPKKIRNGDQTLQGYDLADTSEAFSRYIPPRGPEQPEQPQKYAGKRAGTIQNTIRNVPNPESGADPHKSATVPDVPDQLGVL